MTALDDDNLKVVTCAPVTTGNLLYWIRSTDYNGNRLSDPTSSYTYDGENRLTLLKQGGTNILQNSYDGDGVRVARLANSMTTHFVGEWYDLNPTGVAIAYYPFNGVPIAMKQGTNLSYLHHDPLGSLVSTTSAVGVEISSARYLPFGYQRPACVHG